VLERLDLAANSTWSLDAERETWLLVVGGSARIGPLDLATGDAVFAQAERTEIHAGAGGMVCLVAYTGVGMLPHLLQCLGQPSSADEGRQADVPAPISVSTTKAAPAGMRLEKTQ
jgi:mannose-6-phosphate isomerase